jgi:hypothetical protein
LNLELGQSSHRILTERSNNWIGERRFLQDVTQLDNLINFVSL